MKFDLVSHNGTIISKKEANLPVYSLEVVYGFGVYETIKVRNSIPYFLPQHIQRLFTSCEEIDLGHHFSEEIVKKNILALIETSQCDSCNLKIILYGGANPDLFIVPSSPYYPDRAWYRDGVALTAFTYERWMPHAKTLNMLPSYFMYQKAKQKDCYDALLFDHEGNITEGTRTNAYCIKENKIYSPPKAKILEGVTMMTLEKVIENTEYSITYKDIPFDSVFSYEGMFISSTSSKILPVKKIDEKEFSFIPQSLYELIDIYEGALDRCEGDFAKL